VTCQRGELATHIRHQAHSLSTPGILLQAHEASTLR